jgi:hypothetical protein
MVTFYGDLVVFNEFFVSFSWIVCESFVNVSASLLLFASLLSLQLASQLLLASLCCWRPCPVFAGFPVVACVPLVAGVPVVSCVPVVAGVQKNTGSQTPLPDLQHWEGVRCKI